MNYIHQRSLCSQLTNKKTDETLVAGWVDRRRDHGGIIFIDLRDHTGTIQLVIDPKKSELESCAPLLSKESVISASGKIIQRTADTVNKELATGSIELVVEKLTILNIAKQLPFHLDSEDTINEELRLSYRYLDIRREEMQKNLRFRHELVLAIRTFLSQEDFCEVETPTLSKSTPEGAREFLVPSRIYPGEFYALPQSPQIYKQLLMTAGMYRYFQIARCYRDEALRADRQPEFTQLDMELSFTDETQIQDITERLLGHLWEKFFKKPLPLPLKRYSYDDLFFRYGSDKADLRYAMEIVEITKLFDNTQLHFLQKILINKGRVGAIRLPKETLSRSDLEYWVTKTIKELDGSGLIYVRFQENGAPISPIAQHLPPNFLTLCKELWQDCSAEDTIFIVAGNYEKAWTTLGRLRIALAEHFKIIDTTKESLYWVIDFPLLEWDEEEKHFVGRHHQFTSPQDGYNIENPAEIKARAYDLVWNGAEIGGGSIRNHTRVAQETLFKLMDMPQEIYETKFGFLLKAFDFGFPPHGGIAFGIDRMVMNFLRCNSIRDVIAFPKTQHMRCLMMESPTPITPKQEKEIHFFKGPGQRKEK